MRRVSVIQVATALASGFTAPLALAQSGLPSSSAPQPVGFQTERLAAIDLADQLQSLTGRSLRLSRTTIAAGGHYAAHSHDGHPEIIYVLEGILTEQRDGQETQHGPGDVLVMTKNVTHALANKSTAPVTYLSIVVRTL